VIEDRRAAITFYLPARPPGISANLPGKPREMLHRRSLDIHARKCTKRQTGVRGNQDQLSLVGESICRRKGKAPCHRKPKETSRLLAPIIRSRRRANRNGVVVKVCGPSSSPENTGCAGPCAEGAMLPGLLLSRARDVDRPSCGGRSTPRTVLIKATALFQYSARRRAFRPNAVLDV